MPIGNKACHARFVKAQQMGWKEHPPPGPPTAAVRRAQEEPQAEETPRAMPPSASAETPDPWRRTTPRADSAEAWTASELSPVVAGGTPASGGSAPPVTVVQASPEVQCCICREHLARSEALPVKGNYICLGCGTEVLEQLGRFQNQA